MNRVLQVIAIAGSSAIIGGVMVWVTQGHTLSIVPGEIEYVDLAAVLLAVAALFLGVLGLALAAVAIWGFNYFKKVAVSTARRAAHSTIASELTSGDAKELVAKVAKDVAEQFIEKEIRSGSTRKYLENKVEDAIAVALANGGLAGSELVAKRSDDREKFRDLDDQGGE